MRTRRLPLFAFIVLAAIVSFLVTGAWLAAIGPALSPAALNALNVAHTQDFNTLAASGASSAVPAGWGFDETGTNANGIYAAGTGSSNAGDTYSFGSAGSTERALGGLRSGALVPVLGAGFTNSTGSVVTSLDVSYVGEQWRLGAIRVPDRLDFQYSTDATSLTTGTWTDVNALDFSSPFTAGPVGARDGNLAANRLLVSAVVTGLNIPNGATFYVRWTDFDVTNADDGLAIDDFSITPRTTTAPLGVGAANPSSVEPGGETLLTVTVTPGTAPPSTGLTVLADLTAIGNSATQAFADDGSNGDVVGGDNIFSYRATVAAGTTAGARALPFVVADSLARSSNGAIALTVLPTFRAIPEIQGTGSLSPYATTAVTTSGIVTGVKTGSAGGFFIQTAEPDGSELSSEGIFVFTAGVIPAAAVIGNSVKVTGTVQEFRPSADPASPTLTEISGNPTVTLVSAGNPLPAPVTLTAGDAGPAGTIEQLERFEGMRVRIDSLTVIAPTDGFTSEANATSVSDGAFFGVITGIARPFRAPGIEVPNPLPAGSPCCVPRFDANPERIRVDSDAQPGAVAIDVTAGAIVTNLAGPLDYGSRVYTLLPDAATPPSFTGNVSATPVPVPGERQFTVASFNMERFFDTTNDPGTSDVALTVAAFNNRLNKASLAIRTMLRAPDVIGVQEVENLTTLQAIAGKVNSDALTAGEPYPDYQAYLEEGNDPGGIDVGFLVKAARVTAIDVVQLGKATTFTDPSDGSVDILNDRPPLMLRATIQPPSGSVFAITVINNHLRSLNDVEDPVAGGRVRAKRRAQAEFLADLIQGRQVANPGERIISVGDYNAFEFSDGLVDVMGTVKGTPTPAEQVVLASNDRVNPDLIDLVELAPEAERYSFVFGGNAQELDHVLITGNLLTRFVSLNYARTDADFPEVYRTDANRPERLSDHDPSVAYFSFPSTDLAIAKSATANPVLSGASLAYTLTVENSPSDAAETLVVSDHVPAGTAFVSLAAPSGWSCSAPAAGTTGAVTCSSAFLAAGATASFTVVVGVECSLPDGTAISNTATVTSGTFDPVPANNSSAATVAVSNPAPVVIPPADATYQSVQQVPPASAADATVSDNCGVPAVVVVQSSNGGAGSPASPLVITRTYTATDSAGRSSSATQTITVIDDTPPSINGLALDKSSLWPPNHTMHLVTLTYGVADNVSTPSIAISVSSNEPVNGAGDGDTAPDWEVVDAKHVRLRSERSGQGAGRVYTIHVTATDGAGNRTVSDVSVLVPHNK